jgi:uncharacterized protein (TIGR02268 family)
VRRIEVSAAPPAQAPRVRLSPGRTTVLTFDTPVRRVEVAGQERWGPKLSADSQTLNLKPTSAVQLGEEVTLTVHFEDGAAPEQARFLLGVHPAGPEEVEVSRYPRTLESYRLEAGEQRARAAQCEGELARVQAEGGGAGGLTQVVDTGLVGEESLTHEKILHALAERPGNALKLEQAYSYRTSVRLLLKVRLSNPGAEAWTAAGATLTPQGGGTLKVLSVWQRAPIAPGDLKPPHVYVEAELTPEAQGPYTLRLWAEGGTRAVTLGGLPLP